MPPETFSDFREVARLLKLNPAEDIPPAEWRLTQDSFHPREIPFLDERFVGAACEEIGMGREPREAVLAALPMFERHPALRRLAWHYHAMIFQVAGDPVGYLGAKVPMPDAALDPDALMFQVFIALSGWPHMKSFYARRGIPREIALDTIQDVEVWLRTCREWYGRWQFRQLFWVVRHLVGRLFRLGRLQFCFETFGQDLHAYRRRDDGRVVLLAGDGAWFRRDGQYDGADGVSEGDRAWAASYRVMEDSVTGNPISADGRARPETLTLPRKEWLSTLQKGDPILGLHIPATGLLTPDACGESFRRAAAFFPRYFPDRPWRAVCSHSWLFDPQLGEKLPSHSNIALFQKEFYLHPVPKADARQTYERVFGPGVLEIADAPRRTSLQRLIAEHVEQGGRWRIGGAILFIEDLNWGGQVYRSGRGWTPSGERPGSRT